MAAMGWTSRSADARHARVVFRANRFGRLSRDRSSKTIFAPKQSTSRLTRDLRHATDFSLTVSAPSCQANERVETSIAAVAEANW